MRLGDITRRRDDATCTVNVASSHRCVIYCLLLVLLLPGCAIIKGRDIRSAQKIQREVACSSVFSKALTGFTLLDPATGKTLADVHGDRYFTPASNTKILTLATCLEVLGDSVPGLLYQFTDSTFKFRSTADPTFLHPKFEAWQHIAGRLRQAPQKKMYWMVDPNIPGLGPGWAWDDAPYDYSAERSVMPVFGNTSHVFAVRPDSLAIGKGNWHKLEELVYDERLGNNSLMFPSNENIIIRYSDLDTFDADFEMFFPVIDVSNVESCYGYLKTITLLENGLNRDVYEDYNLVPRTSLNTWNSTPIDTVLRRMMHQSDNFIAEQMLLVCAGVKFDALQQDKIIQWMLDSTLSSLPQRPKWVDGSGLSRYNLMSPQSIAQVLLTLWNQYPHERLLSLFPAGGVQGTLSDWYASKDGKPYVFAKTGGMSGVACLSGYLRCKSGRILIFSFMHNHYVGSSRAWKAEMQRLLERMHARF